jgi:hypothetical protein
VNMRVIPIRAGRLTRRNLEAVFEGPRSGGDQSADDVILVANGRHRETVKVQVCRESINRTTAARCCWCSRGMHMRRGTDTGGREKMQIITQSEDQPLAGVHTQRGSFEAIAVGIAITDFAVFKEIAISKVRFKRAVLATKIRWLGYFGTGRGARTHDPISGLMRWNGGCKFLGSRARVARFYSVTRAFRVRPYCVSSVLGSSRPRRNRFAAGRRKRQQQG